MASIRGDSADTAVPGVYGENSVAGDGVYGEGGNNGRGVVGVSLLHTGVEGTTRNGIAIYGGASESGRGVVGVSKIATAVEGNSNSGVAVWGISQTGDGAHGESMGNGRGVAGFSNTGQGVYGHSNTNVGVVGESDQFDGVFGISRRPDHAGVSGVCFNADGTVNEDGLAGYFNGNVFVGKLTVKVDVVLENADCAEDFDIACSEQVEPGTVMVIDSEGALKPSDRSYDKRAAGVIAGAGNYKPGLILDKQPSSNNRMPIALMGKVYCKVDATYGAIEVGDLLTTSPTPGHAMKATDPQTSFGATLGKALRAHYQGQGIIPILVALQ